MAAFVSHLMKKGLLLFHIFFRQFNDFLKPAADIVVVLSFMRHEAVRTVLDAAFCNFEVSAAFSPQSIQRAVAEQAVEIFRIVRRMTRKKLAFLVLKKLEIFCFHHIHHTSPFSHQLSVNSVFDLNSFYLLYHWISDKKHTCRSKRRMCHIVWKPRNI